MPGYKLIEVDPKDVALNKSNPRGEGEEQIKSDASFTLLVESVYNYGVLVPIVVKEQNQRSRKKYQLIDGERRLRAAKATSTNPIPARISKPKKTADDLTQAFHIHMLRKQWGSTAITRSVKLMLKELRKENKNISVKKLRDELQDRTGFSKKQLDTYLNASKYSEAILDDVDNKKLAWSHLIQNEESFIKPIKRNYPKLLKVYGERKIRNTLIRKAKRNVLTSTRALIDNIIPVMTRVETDDQKKFVENELNIFIQDEDIRAEEILNNFEREYPESQKDVLEIIKKSLYTAQKLESLLQMLPKSKMLSYPAKAKELKGTLDSLKKEITRQQKNINKIDL